MWVRPELKIVKIQFKPLLQSSSDVLKWPNEGKQKEEEHKRYFLVNFLQKVTHSKRVVTADHVLCDDAPETIQSSAAGLEQCWLVARLKRRFDLSSRGSCSHSPVASDTEVEASQPVTAQRVGAALEEEHRLSYSLDSPLLF